MNLVLRSTYDTPSMKPATIMAACLHAAMFYWNPVVLPGSVLNPSEILMKVEYRETLPEPPKPPPPVKKPEVKKAKKAGLEMVQPKRAPAPIRAVKKQPSPPKIVAKPAPVPRTRPSAVKMPKFVPRATDEDAMVAAAPTRTAQATALKPATNPFGAPTKLSGKTRGIRAAEVDFQLKDRGGISGGGPVVAIPVGDSRAEMASIGAAATLREAPRGGRHISHSSYQAPLGDGVGELAGKNRSGYVGHIQVGSAGPSDQEIIAAGTTHGDPGGKGFEVGGPVGDRKIIKRLLPDYPAWAEEKGITAMVKIFFTVKADGSIRQSIRVVRSSGYTELDQLAKEAILAWKFSPTHASSTAEEAWGVVTFRFTLA